MDNREPDGYLTDAEAEKRGLLLCFLEAIGGEENLKAVQDHPEVFMRLRWPLMPAFFRNTLCAMLRLPELARFPEWYALPEKRRHYVAAKVQVMARRASHLISEMEGGGVAA